jgi:hypothetical protein
MGYKKRQYYHNKQAGRAPISSVAAGQTHADARTTYTQYYYYSPRTPHRPPCN